MNSTHFHHSTKVLLITEYVQFVVTLSFTGLAVFVLLYYIHRRYSLYKEIMAITSQQLWQPDYQNHKKNLKIMSMIANFVIIILLIEIGNNFTEFTVAAIYIFRRKFHMIIFHLAFILQSCYVPILCVLMKVLWLVYLHSPYRNNIMRWTAYVVLRLIVLYLIHSWQLVYVNEESTIRVDISLLIFIYIRSTYQVIDLITYILYSRRFYLHLRSRELEARLFHEEKYLEAKYVRIHFKIATVLVSVAISLYTLSEAMSCIFNLSINLSKFVNELFTFPEWSYYLQAVLISRYIMLSGYRLLSDANYMYVFSVILFKYCRRKYKLTRINEKIRPYIREYHEDLDTRTVVYW